MWGRHLCWWPSCQQRAERSPLPGPACQRAVNFFKGPTSVVPVTASCTLGSASDSAAAPQRATSQRSHCCPASNSCVRECWPPKPSHCTHRRLETALNANPTALNTNPPVLLEHDVHHVLDGHHPRHIATVHHGDVPQVLLNHQRHHVQHAARKRGGKL